MGGLAFALPFGGAFGSTIVNRASFNSLAGRTVTVASVPSANVGSVGGVTTSSLTVTRMSRSRTLFAVMVRDSDAPRVIALLSHAGMQFLPDQRTQRPPTVWLAAVDLPMRCAPSPTI